MHSKLIALKKDPLFQGFKATPLTQIIDSNLQQKGVELWLKRDDLIHPVISGNKWRKLKYILQHALELKSHTLISMGGAYSNHLHAMAFIGQKLGLKTIAYIRGEEPATYSPTLTDISNWGMELRFTSRSTFRQLREYKNHNALPDMQAGEYWIPEGGSSNLALQGVAEIIEELQTQTKFDVLCVPCGTATTMAGLLKVSPDPSQLIGFAALKNASYLYQDIENILEGQSEAKKALINLDYHFGGFAKITPELLSFIEDFEKKQKIKLDKVYTGKMLYGLFDLVKKEYFKRGQKIIAVHTGGLQGNRKA